MPHEIDELDDLIGWMHDGLINAKDSTEAKQFEAGMRAADIARGNAMYFHGVRERPDHENEVGVQNGSVQIAPSGIEFVFRDPKPWMFRVTDIAYHLARVHRFGGGSDGTVAQHLVEGVQFMPTLLLKRCWLMHDVEEFVMGDMPAPLKNLVGGDYREIATIIRVAAFKHFGLPESWARRLPAAVKALDGQMLEWERTHCMPKADWIKPIADPPTARVYKAWDKTTAENQWLREFAALWPNWEF